VSASADARTTTDVAQTATKLAFISTSPAVGLSFICPRQHVITLVNGEKEVVNCASRIRQDFGMNNLDGWSNRMFRAANLPIGGPTAKTLFRNPEVSFLDHTGCPGSGLSARVWITGVILNRLAVGAFS
jgi:hypothetical protein